MTPAPTPPFKSNQYEFTDEQNKAIAVLAGSMGTVATLGKVLGLAFLGLFGLTLYQAIQGQAHYGPAAGMGAGALFTLGIGFLSADAAHSFRRVVETKNEDVWHLMNALGSLNTMFGVLRAVVLICLALLVVGLAVVGYAVATGGR